MTDDTTPTGIDQALAAISSTPAGQPLPTDLDLAVSDAMQATADLDGVTLADRPTFTPGYPVSDARIYRARLRIDRTDGTATVTFRGDIADATRCWAERSPRDGRLSVYAEVVPTDDTATSIKVAVVPTGKRIPGGPEDVVRLGSAGGSHVYLLEVDDTVDRAAYDAERAQRRADRETARAAMWADDDSDTAPF